MAGLSKRQMLILIFLDVKPEMTAKELAEMVFKRPVEYKSKEYSTISRSLSSLERQGIVEKVQVKLKWRIKSH
jgi:DNA-binding MarR family transcriptional regulator